MAGVGDFGISVPAATFSLTFLPQTIPDRARTPIITPVVVSALKASHGSISSILVLVGQTWVIEAGMYKSAGRRQYVYAHEPAGNQLAGIRR